MNDIPSKIERTVVIIFEKLSQMIVLGFLWIIGCLPLVTVFTSTTALYHATVSSVRKGQGSTAGAYWESYRANLGKGIAATVMAAAAGTLFSLNLLIMQTQPANLYSSAAVVGLVLLASCAVYLPPVLSEFRVGVLQAWKIAFLMSFRYVHFTLLILIASAFLAILQLYFLPIPTIVLLPGVWCYGTSFLIEKVLHAYMPQREE